MTGTSDAANSSRPGSRIRKLLARETSPNRKYIPEIDGLRFIAIAGVLLFHLHDQARLSYPAFRGWSEHPDALYRVLQKGHLGVELFFVISGFILALPFAKHYLAGRSKIRLKDYFLRRLSRLEPPYLINLTIFLLALVILRGDRIQDLIGPYLASATYTHNILYGEMSRVNFVAWSLEVEAQFYVLAPLIACLLGIRNPIWRRGTIVSIAIGSYAISSQLDVYMQGRMPVTVLRYLPLFLAGFLLSDIYVMHWSRSKSRSFVADGLFLIGTTIVLLVPSSAMQELLLAVAMSLVVAGGLTGRLTAWFVSRPWIATIGGMCYTIYLYHFLMMTGASRVTRGIEVPGGFGLNFLLQASIILPVVLASCAILFLVFEKPFMKVNWISSFFPSQRKATGVNHAG